MSKYTPCPKCGRLLNRYAPANMKEHQRTHCGADMYKKRVKREGREEERNRNELFIQQELSV